MGYLSMGHIIAIYSTTCACVQRGTCLYRFCGGDCIKTRALTLGRCIASLCHFMSYALVALGIANALHFSSHDIHARKYWDTIVLTLMWSQTLSWCFGIATGSFIFACNWRGVKFLGITVIHQQSGQITRHYCFPHGAEYPTQTELGAQMFWDNDRSSCKACCMFHEDV